MKISKVELKAIKTFEGMDGYGLNANVYINGKREAVALDEGCGGEMLLRWEHDLHGESREVEEAFGAWCEAHRHWIDFVESMRKGSPDKGIPAATLTSCAVGRGPLPSAIPSPIAART